MKRLRQVLAIASCTARELVRSPAFAILAAAGAALVVSSPLFAVFHLGQQVKLVADLGLGTTLVLGVLVGILGASWELGEELENLTVYSILAKPVSRASYLAGKYLGVLVSASAAAAVPLVALLLTLRGLAPDRHLLYWCLVPAAISLCGGTYAFVKLSVRSSRSILLSASLVLLALVAAIDGRGVLALYGRAVSGWSWILAPAYAGVVLQLAVLSAVAIAVSTRLGLAGSLPVLLALFVLGQIAGTAREAGGAGSILGVLIPDLTVFQFSDAIVEQLSQGTAALGSPIDLGTFLGAAAVSTGYVIGALTVAGAFFAGRDVR